MAMLGHALALALLVVTWGHPGQGSAADRSRAQGLHVVHQGTRGGTQAASLALSRRQLKQDQDACSQATCPATTTCQAGRGGVPLCVCPSSAPNLLNSACTTEALGNADFLNAHNYARAAAGAPALVWNDSLALLASAWAQTLTGNCFNLQHGMLQDSAGAALGQNLAAQAGSPGVPQNDTWPVEAWASEFKFYDYAPVGAKKECAGGHTCGHYTQVMWSGTVSLGCAAAPCVAPQRALSGFVYVCNYFPAGNVLGQYPYAQQAPRVPVSSKRTKRARRGKRTRAASPMVCQGVACPAPATCQPIQVTQGSVPVCSCPVEQALVEGSCSAVGGVVSTTNLAVYNGAKFAGQKGVGRVGEGPSGCFTFPPATQGKLMSFSLVADVGVGAAPVPAPFSARSCSNLVLWTGPGCTGTSTELQPKGEALLQENVNAWYKPLVQSASASCTFA